MRLETAGPRTWLLATLAGWALLAWILALAGMGGRIVPLAEDPALLQKLPQPRRAPPERLGPLAQYSEIAARPLFSEDRRPQAFSLTSDSGEEDKGDAFDYVLTSVLITPRLQEAIVQPTAGGESIRIKLNEAADALTAWRLVSLAPRSAVFEGPGGQKNLELRVYNGTGGEAPTAVEEPPPSMTDANEAAPDLSAGPASAPVPAAPPPTAAVKPAVPPAATGTPRNEAADAAAASSAQAQMDAIRKRIEARRAQLRQEAQQQTPPAQNP